MMDLNKLEELARAATPGPWVTGEVYAENGAFSHLSMSAADGTELIGDDLGPGRADTEFIAAANPAAVMDLIDLVRKQEAELAARKPLADSFVAPGVTVDTPEFGKRVADFCDAHERGGANYMSKTWIDLITHIDAHTASAVAAARLAKENAAEQAQQHAMEAKAQRGTVLDILRHFGCAEEDWNALTLVKAAHEREVQEAVARAVQSVAVELPPQACTDPAACERSGCSNPTGRCEEAAQPVQQPAAPFESVEERERWIAVNEMIRAASANPAIFLEVPTAPAAGVQGDKWRGCIAQIVVDTPLPERNDKYQSGFVDAKEAILSRLREAGYLNAPTTVQPDSGRDAALVQALKDIAESCNCCGDRSDLSQIAQDALDATIGHYELSKASQFQMMEHGLTKTFAAHPAPSSDAAAWVALRSDIKTAMSTALTLPEMRKWKAHLATFDAAHPANGAQAGLSDEQIVTALHSLGVDTYPSKFGFSTLQVSATSVPTIRQLVELLAAPQKKEG